MDTLVNYANRCRLQYTYSPVVASLPRRKLQRAYHTHPSNYHSLCSFTYLQNFLFKQNSPSPFHFLSHLPDTHTCSHRRVLLYRRFPQANTRQMEHHRAPINREKCDLVGRWQAAKAIGHWRGVVAPARVCVSISSVQRRANEPQNALTNRSNQPCRYKNRRDSVPYFLQVSRPLG